MKLSIRIQERKFGKCRFEKEYYKKPRLYLDLKKEILMDNLQNRRSRLHIEIKKVLSLDKDLLQQLNIKDISQLSWSQKAGCSCGCSPGFIISSQDKATDYWLTIE